MCEMTDAAPYLAVIGILSHDSEQQAFLRHTSRSTWLAATPPNLVLRFVLRANGSANTRHEQEQHADVTLIDAPAQENQGAGALISLFRWLSCALNAWPAAQAVGKAEDDVWIQLESASMQLSAALAMRASATEHLYWGTFETYHWLPSVHAARGWRYWPCSWIVNCSERRYTFSAHDAAPLKGNDVSMFATDDDKFWNALVGPFSFAKGPLFALSSGLARVLVDNRKVGAERRAAVQQARRRFNVDDKAATAPYEDVFTGLAVTLAADAPVRIVGMPKNAMATIISSGRIDMAPSTTVVHLSHKEMASAQMLAVQRFASARHCAPGAHDIECFVNGSLCNGAPFTGCIIAETPFKTASCSLELENIEANPKMDQAKLGVSCAVDALRMPTITAPANQGRKWPKGYVGRGTCAVTDFGESDCVDSSKGAWPMDLPLDNCIALCRCCAQCHYVSHSRKQGDCSWFRECDEKTLMSHGAAATHVTVRVRGNGSEIR